MSRPGLLLIVVAAFVLACGSGVQAQVVIETVTVGNPGNPDDTHGDGYGGVDYEYSMGTFEVTAGRYTEFLNAVAAEDTYGLYSTSMWSGVDGCMIERTGSPGSYGYSVAGDWADRPVNFVSWGDAARFANWLHNGQPTGAQDLGTTEDGAYYLNGAMSDGELIAVVREPDARWVIPSEDEWYKAAYHYNDGVTGNYYGFPTSSDSVPGYVDDDGNLSGTGEPFTEGGTDPGNYATYDGDGGTNGIGSPYYRTEVGEWESSESPYGTFDQGGNVWEWNEAVIGSSRGLRGGAYSNYDSDLYAAARNMSVPTAESHFFGFRIVRLSGACIFHDGTCQEITESACNDLGGKWIGPGTLCNEEIPAVSEWGLLVMALLGLAAGTVMFRQARRRAVTC